MKAEAVLGEQVYMAVTWGVVGGVERTASGRQPELRCGPGEGGLTHLVACSSTAGCTDQ